MFEVITALHHNLPRMSSRSFCQSEETVLKLTFYKYETNLDLHSIMEPQSSHRKRTITFGLTQHFLTPQFMTGKSNNLEIVFCVQLQKYTTGLTVKIVPVAFVLFNTFLVVIYKKILTKILMLEFYQKAQHFFFFLILVVPEQSHYFLRLHVL